MRKVASSGGGGARRIVQVLVPFTAAYLLSELVRNVNGVLAPYLRHDFSLSALQLGTLTAAFLAALAGSQVVVGVALDRYGPKRVVAWTMGLAALAAAGFAMADGFAQLLATRFFIGLGLCACWTGAYKANALWWPEDRLPLINAVTISFASLGSLAATWPTEAMLQIVSWRWIFIGVAALIAALVVIFALLVPRHPQEAQEGQTSARDQITGLMDVARGRIFWRVAPLSFLTQGAWIAYQGIWAGEWLREVGGKSDATAAAILTGLAIGVVVGQLGLGLLADRNARSEKAFFAMTATLSGLFVVTQAALLFRPEGFHGFVWAAYGVLTAGPIFGYALLTRLVPSSASGSAISLLNFFAVLCGTLFQGVVGLLVTAWPADGAQWSGHQIAMAALVMLQVGALIWMVLGGRRGTTGYGPETEATTGT